MGVITVVVAVLGSALSLGTIIFLAGALKGAVGTRLDNIESRLTEIEHAMRRGGFTIRHVGDE